MVSRIMTDGKTQADKFKDAARDLDCDTDEKRWDAKLKKVVKHKPVEKSV
jgi:hypothetical protein